MRFLFRGFERDTGNPVQGHVEAAGEDLAYEILSQNGIITEPPLHEDPKPPHLAASPSPISEFESALESALDSSSSQVAFDDLTARYRGKKVWVIDRDKIRQRVAQVVDSTLASSEANSESGSTARERVASAISGLFHDTHNIATQRNAESIAGMPANAQGGISNNDLAQQIGRLTGVVEQAEGLIAAMSAALRNADTGGSGPRRHMIAGRAAAPSFSAEQNEVFREIFQLNLALRRAIVGQTTKEPIQQPV